MLRHLQIAHVALIDHRTSAAVAMAFRKSNSAMYPSLLSGRVVYLVVLLLLLFCVGPFTS